MNNIDKFLFDDEDEDVLDEASSTAEEAHRYGLIYKGHGVWMDANRNSVAKTVNGKLVWFNKALNQPQHVAPKPTAVPQAITQHQLPKALQFPALEEISKKNPFISLEEISGMTTEEIVKFLKEKQYQDPTINLLDPGHNTLKIKLHFPSGKSVILRVKEPRKAWDSYLSSALLNQAIPEYNTLCMIDPSKYFPESKEVIWTLDDEKRPEVTEQNKLVLGFFGDNRVEMPYTSINVDSIFSPYNNKEFNGDKIGLQIPYDEYGKQLRKIIEVMRSIGSFYNFANKVVPIDPAKNLTNTTSFGSGNSRYNIISNFANNNQQIWTAVKELYRIIINKHNDTRKLVDSDSVLKENIEGLTKKVKFMEGFNTSDLAFVNKYAYELKCSLRDIVNYGDWTQYFYVANRDVYVNQKLFKLFFEMASALKAVRTEKIAASGKLIPRKLRLEEAAAFGATHFLKHDPVPVSETIVHHEGFDGSAEWEKACKKFGAKTTHDVTKWDTIDSHKADDSVNQTVKQWRMHLPVQDSLAIGTIQRNWQYDGFQNQPPEKKKQWAQTINKVIGGLQSNKPATIEFSDHPIERGLRLEAFHVMEFMNNLKKPIITMECAGFSFKPRLARSYANIDNRLSYKSYNEMGVLLRVSPNAQTKKIIGMPLNGLHHAQKHYKDILKVINDKTYYDDKPWDNKDEIRDKMAQANAGCSWEDLNKLVNNEANGTSASYAQEYEIIRPGNVMMKLKDIKKHVFINDQGIGSVVYEVNLEDQGITKDPNLVVENIEQKKSKENSETTWRKGTGGAQFEQDKKQPRPVIKKTAPTTPPPKKESLSDYNEVFKAPAKSVDSVSILNEIKDPQLILEYISSKIKENGWKYLGNNVWETSKGVKVTIPMPSKRS